jgi:hypothetical protein
MRFERKCSNKFYYSSTQKRCIHVNLDASYARLITFSAVLRKCLKHCLEISNLRKNETVPLTSSSSEISGSHSGEYEV